MTYSRNWTMRWLLLLGTATLLVFAATSARADEPPTPSQEPSQQQFQQRPQQEQPPRKPAPKKHQKPYEPREPTPIRDASNQTEVVVRSYEALKRQHIVMQKRDFSCGAAALATIAHYYWDDNVDEDLFLRALDQVLTDQEIIDRIKNGLAMSDLRRAAVLVGYQSTVGKLTFEKLGESKVPLVVGIKPSGHKHFVVYRGTDGMWVYVADPIRGNLRMPIRDFVDQWQEHAVLVVYKPGQKVKERSALSLTDVDLHRGETTDQYIRAQATRQPLVKQAIRP
jgi:uncharacterized protein